MAWFSRIFRPQHHKSAHRGKDRCVPLESEAQAELRDLLDCVPRPDPEAPLFPALRNRKTKKTKRCEGGFTLHGYRQWIIKACKLAGVEPWAPNMLRHACATRIYAERDMETAQLYLGHEDIQTTILYTHLIPFGEEQSLEHIEHIARLTLK